jgi:hypothetical protein
LWIKHAVNSTLLSRFYEGFLYSILTALDKFVQNGADPKKDSQKQPLKKTLKKSCALEKECAK